MPSPDLRGRSVLIVEDEPAIALDIARAFENVGARVTLTNTLRHALLLVEHAGIPAAILNRVLGDEDGDGLCQRLKGRAVAFITL